MTFRRFRTAARASVVCISLGLASAPAHAQWVVFDPSNYAQNILTAPHTLQQVNNQITSLQNEAQMLINQARNLANLPLSTLQQLEQNVQRTQALIAQAQGIAYNVQNIDRAFRTSYAPASTTASSQSQSDGAQQRWQQSVQGLQDAMRTQATVVGNLPNTTTQMSSLVTASQGAVNIRQGEQKPPAFQSLNPNGKVPVIVDSDGPDEGPITITESAAILIYLAKKFGRFIPETATGKVRMFEWLFFHAAGLGPAFGQSGYFQKLAPEPIPAAIERFHGAAKRTLKVLDGRLGEVEYLAGEYSIADIANFGWIRVTRPMPPR